MSTTGQTHGKGAVREPKNLSPRIRRLRDYYFKGALRTWNNEITAWTTGTPWDIQFDEMSFYIVPEMYPFLDTFRSSIRQAARPVKLHQDFWKWSLPERRAWFTKEVMLAYVPQEILPGDLIAGARFNVQTSRCWTKDEASARDRLIYGRKGARASVQSFHGRGCGNAGATPGHLIPGYERVLKTGWKGIYEDIRSRYEACGTTDRKGPKGAELRAMMTAATMAKDVAWRYARLCGRLGREESDPVRRDELAVMEQNLKRVPWEPARTFWEAVQSLWITHMLVMSDECYPGPGLSFGRIDQYLLPCWNRSIAEGMSREFGKEIMKCFWIHANTAYDAMIRVGNQGITSGYGQLITLSGMGASGRDMTNDLTYAMLDVIDDLSPILEPKPNVRLHRGSPEKLLDRLVDMIAESQGSPFLLNFDERSMAGLMLQATASRTEHLVNKENVFDYAPVGCLENTMAGNDRSGTVDNNINLIKAVELALNSGRDFFDFIDPITGKRGKAGQAGPKTGNPARFRSFEDFFDAYEQQTRHLIGACAGVYEKSEAVRAEFCPTPYLSCLVKGCAEKALDITRGGAELNFTTIEAGTFATTVDSLLAIKYLVFDRKVCTMRELVKALKADWKGYETLRAQAVYRAPKYGRDDDEADALATRVMKTWCEETWKHRTKSTRRQFRPGMLSWNYWAGDASLLPATPDGRTRGRFLSNALCPVSGTDVNGPTANMSSAGKALGGKAENGRGHWGEFFNLLPNGASHTITISPSLVSDPEHKAKLRAFLQGCVESGGTSLQINVLDAATLRDAQERPEEYRSLLVRITGYNAFFTGIGRELQDEVIARISHGPE